MKLNKKGVQLALSTIITIIILLLVVVVLVVLLAKSTRQWEAGTKCISLGGKCSTEACPGNELTEGSTSCGPKADCCEFFS